MFASHRSRFAALLIVLPLILAACSDADDDVSGPTATASISSQVTTSAATTSMVESTSVAATSTGGTSSEAVGGPSTSFELTGLIGKPATFEAGELEALTATTVTTNPQAGSGSLGEHSYSGPLLWDLIQAAEPTLNAAIKNDGLRRGIVVTGSDGYETAIAWGEIDPKFAGKQIIVAYQQDGEALPEEDGFARLIVPGDGFAGRYVSNIVKIDLKDAIDAPEAGERGASTAFELAGLVETPGEFDLAALEAMPQTEVTVTGSNGATSTYTGVLLSDLLAGAVVQLDPDMKNDMLSKAIVGVGSDGYASIVTGGEIEAKFGNVQVLIAITLDGQPLDAGDGFARIVVPGDAAAGRYVSNLVRLEVVDL